MSTELLIEAPCFQDESIRSDIFETLKASPDKRFSGRSLAKYAGVSYSKLQKILSVLCDGVKFERSVTGEIYYFFTTALPVAPPVRTYNRSIYKSTHAMQLAMARCRADRGYEFSPISIS